MKIDTEPFNSSVSIFKERTNINYSLVAENVQATIPEKFDFSLPGGEFTSPYLIKFFKGENQTEADILFGIPLDQIIYYPNQRFETALFTLNDNQIPKRNFRDSVHINFDSDSAHIVDNYAIRSFSFFADSGILPYSFEILNQTLQKGFVSREEITVPDLTADSLLISDIILAEEILPATGNDHYVKKQLNIVPNLLEAFDNTDTLRVYFEIYNLSSDNAGNVHFRVESTIRKSRGDSFLSKFFNSEKKAISVINEYSGKRTSEFIIQSMDLNRIEPGEYTFEIIVHDDIGKLKSRRWTKLIVLQSVNN